MTLRLAQDPTAAACPTCKGLGTVPCANNYTVRTNVHYSGGEGYGAIRTPDHGRPIPCPECKGKKVIMVAETKP